jgi:hypothetical protein
MTEEEEEKEVEIKTNLGRNYQELEDYSKEEEEIQ